MRRLYLLSILFLVSSGFAQMSHQMDTSSDVPELWDFHDVIYQIWHEAWPDKDIKMLKSLLPEIEEGYSKLANAELPGILRDKTEKWESGIKQMGTIIGTYKAAAEKKEEQPLLKAAEDLHSQFEMLVRLIRPVSKEVDQFHQELYRMYHYYLPDYNYQKISSSADTLKELAANLENAKLPNRLKDKDKAFRQAINNLREKVADLVRTVKSGNDRKAVSEAVEVMHSAYQDVECVFE